MRVLKSYHAYTSCLLKQTTSYRIKLCWKATREIEYNQLCYWDAAEGLINLTGNISLSIRPSVKGPRERVFLPSTFFSSLFLLSLRNA